MLWAMLVFATLLLAATLEARVREAMTPAPNLTALRAIGPPALPQLVKLYRRTEDPERRAAIAEAFYSLGWKSPEAKAALLQDIHTEHPSLRLQVQWALGRVSDDQDVVDTLARIMQNDSNPLFRDKAACALAYDQIHLTEPQKLRLYQQVIKALRDPKLQVRQIAALVLQIHLGQQKGFRADAPQEERENAVRAWEKWLAEYSANL